MGRIRLESISAFARHGYKVRTRCRQCGREADWNPIELGRELHVRGLSQQVENVEDVMRCSGCKHRGAHITAVFADW